MFIWSGHVSHLATLPGGHLGGNGGSISSSGTQVFSEDKTNSHASVLGENVQHEEKCPWVKGAGAAN